MNIDNLSGAVTSTLLSNISFSVALLAVVAMFVIKPILKKKKIDMSAELPVVVLVMVAAMGLGLGISYNSGQETRAESKAFTEQLKDDYGVSSDSSFQEVNRAARYDRIVVFTDAQGSFEIRPHLDGSTMTFFRVDNGTQVSPNS
jgi:predicted aspartyl protease